MAMVSTVTVASSLRLAIPLLSAPSSSSSNTFRFPLHLYQHGSLPRRNPYQRGPNNHYCRPPSLNWHVRTTAQKKRPATKEFRRKAEGSGSLVDLSVAHGLPDRVGMGFGVQMRFRFPPKVYTCHTAQYVLPSPSGSASSIDLASLPPPHPSCSSGGAGDCSFFDGSARTPEMSLRYIYRRQPRAMGARGRRNLRSKRTSKDASASAEGGDHGEDTMKRNSKKDQFPSTKPTVQEEEDAQPPGAGKKEKKKRVVRERLPQGLIDVMIANSWTVYEIPSERLAQRLRTMPKERLKPRRWWPTSRP
ncbi:unnamed protein product [Miscanthus lutarioriparius]|uniref:Uncharacterized protein n=1 Tax=Miscanthus lutarioriparius TaxID=422564 RepID=A0A811RF96_9POAL|nr:unnamed protein product [Miscanthus lutarioriparius]